MAIKKTTFFMWISAIVISLYSCEKKETTSFETNNTSGASCSIKVYYGGSGEYYSGIANTTWTETMEEYDGVGLLRTNFFELRDSVYFEFSDGKVLKFYPLTDIVNQDGAIIGQEASRIDGVNGIEYFPISGISDYTSESSWSKNCDKKDKNCTFSFEITNSYYSLSK